MRESTSTYSPTLFLEGKNMGKNIMTKTKSMLAAVAIGIGLVSTSFVTSAHAEPERACDHQMNVYIHRVKILHDEEIKAVRDSSLIAGAKQAYYKHFDELSAKAVGKAEAERKACYASVKPIQKTMDSLVTFYTGGLSKILPKRMTYVDVSEILAGKPVGDRSALIPHFRDQIGEVFGIDIEHNNGELEKFIRSPIQYVLHLGHIG